MSAIEIVRARRACTVPQQLLKSHELPSLLNTRAVPKRYEETKPAKVQNFTHQRIMDLGELINRQTKDDDAKLRQVMVEKAIADTWDAAHEIKSQAVKEAVEKCQVKHEKELRRLTRLHERAIKEEALAVETTMQNKLREVVEAERVEAAKKLEVAVEKVQEKCAAQLEKAVDSARQEENSAAQAQKQQLLSEASQTLQKAKDELIKSHEISLRILEEQKNVERAVAVEKVKAAEQERRTSSLAALQQQHVLEVAKIEQAMSVVQTEVEKRDREIEKVQRKRELLYDELVKLQADYQNFIDRHPMFDPGQTGYLLADIHDNPNVINPYLEASSLPKQPKS